MLRSLYVAGTKKAVPKTVQAADVTFDDGSELKIINILIMFSERKRKKLAVILFIWIIAQS